MEHCLETVFILIISFLFSFNDQIINLVIETNLLLFFILLVFCDEKFCSTLSYLCDNIKKFVCFTAKQQCH